MPRLVRAHALESRAPYRSRYDPFVGYGRHFPGDRDVARYAEACVRRHGKDAVRSVERYLGECPSLDKRQFLNAVCDHILTFHGDDDV